MRELAAHPSVVVRAGTSAAGMPIGVQIAAAPWREDRSVAGYGRVRPARSRSEMPRALTPARSANACCVSPSAHDSVNNSASRPSDSLPKLSRTTSLLKSGSAACRRAPSTIVSAGSRLERDGCASAARRSAIPLEDVETPHADLAEFDLIEPELRGAHFALPRAHVSVRATRPVLTCCRTAACAVSRNGFAT
jgi:hypothetical protein